MEFPLEVQEILASHLSGRDILQLSLVSRYWLPVSLDEMFWSRLTRERFSRSLLPSYFQRWRDFYMALENFREQNWIILLEIEIPSSLEEARIKEIYIQKLVSIFTTLERMDFQLYIALKNSEDLHYFQTDSTLSLIYPLRGHVTASEAHAEISRLKTSGQTKSRILLTRLLKE